MSMYIRIKRKNQTMFLHTESSSNFADIKKKIATNFNMDVAHIMLLGNDKVDRFSHSSSGKVYRVCY